MCQQHTRTFHIESASCIDIETGQIRHKVEIEPEAPEVVDEHWIPEGPFALGITAGASTPNNKIGETLLKVLEIRGVEFELDVETPPPA
jgi:4-hydroxy-3-methylbut-2-enyl diphosphate reductase